MQNNSTSIIQNPALILTLASVIIGALGLIAGWLYYRLANLETIRDREQYLVGKFEDRKWVEEPLMMEFDTLNAVEATGAGYKIRRLLFGTLDGSVTVSLNSNFGFDEEMWDHEEFMEPYHEVVECDVEFVHQERLNHETVQLIFEMDTIDFDVVAHCVHVYLDFVKAAAKGVDGFSLGRKRP